MAPSRRRSPVRLVWLAAAMAPLLLAGCQLPRFGAPRAASGEGQRISDLWSGFFIAAVLVVLTVWVPLAFVLVRYRRNRRAADPDALPSQRAYVIPLELAYTAVPIVAVAVLFFFSVRVEQKVNAVSDHPAVRVEVVGFQWGWQFRYLGEDFTIDAPPGGQPELVLPIGEASNLKLVSNDVNHSFWVPNFLSKRDLIPGVRNEITVHPNRAGRYVGRCAEFCGLDHWRMSFQVKVVPMPEYRTWLAAHRGVGVGS